MKGLTWLESGWKVSPAQLIGILHLWQPEGRLGRHTSSRHQIPAGYRSQLQPPQELQDQPTRHHDVSAEYTIQCAPCCESYISLRLCLQEHIELDNFNWTHHVPSTDTEGRIRQLGPQADRIDVMMSFHKAVYFKPCVVQTSEVSDQQLA